MSIDWIYPKQLDIELTNELKFVYILIGNDLCILKDSQLNIIKKAKVLDFNEHIKIELDTHYNWNKIFNLCRMQSLFQRKKILSLKFIQENLIAYFHHNISLLSSFLHEDLLLILYIYTSDCVKRNYVYFQSLIKIGVFVICMTPKYTQLIEWIMVQAKHLKLIIDKLTCQLLCYYYEDNLILLKQTLKILTLIYPDGKLSFLRVKKIITDSTCFNINYWIEAILTGNKKRADHILQQLEYSSYDLETLLRKIQFEILILINIKYNSIQKISHNNLLEQYKLNKKYHYKLLSCAVKRLSMHQLYQSLELLVQIELKHKKDHSYISKSNLELLTMILCS